MKTALLVALLLVVSAFAIGGTALATPCATINSFTAATTAGTQTFTVQHLNDNSLAFNNACDPDSEGITALEADSEVPIVPGKVVAIPSGQISPSSPSYGTYTVEVDEGANTSDELIKYTPSSNPGTAYTQTLTIYTFSLESNATVAETVVVNVQAAPLPAVTSISPTSGPTGTAVTLTGTNLASASSVTFGGTAGTVTNNTATSITVTAPTHAAGQVDILVTTANGTSAVVAGDKFTYVANPTLTPSSTTPSAIEGTAYTVGSPAFSVTPSGGSGSYTSYALNYVSGPTVASLGLSFDTTSGKITGTPSATGAAVFTVTVTDSASNTGTTAQVTLTVNAGVPSAPVIGTATAGNAQASITFSAPASSNGSVITGYTMTSTPGGFTGSGGSSPIIVTSLVNGTSYSFKVTATNAIGTGAASAASNSVIPLAPPTAGAVSATVAFDSTANPITLNLGGGTAASVAVASAANHGTATAGGTAITYTPTNGYSGSDSFTYTATNTSGTSTPGTVTITVTPQTPTAGAVSATVAFGSTANPITLNLGGGTAASVAVASAANHGTATASGTSITYTPTNGYSGSDSFTYTATNTGGTSAPGTVTITVNPAAPTAGAVSATVAFDSTANPITLNLGGGTAASVAVASAANHGTATAGGTSITYTPTNGYSGSDSFTYTATNVTGTSTPATVTITVTPQAPTAGTASATVAFDSTANPITLNLGGGTAVSVAVASAANHGTATASGTSITYTPTNGYSGSDSFTYTATNTGGTSAPGTVTITVTPQAPTAGAVSATVGFDTSANLIPLTLGGGTATSVAVSTAAAHGTATAGGASITYTPTPGYSGPDSFAYTATNAGGTSSPATVTITVTPQAPTAGAVSATVAFNSTANPITLSLGGGTAASVAVASAAGHGTATASGTSISYTPTPGYSGSDSFTYTATNPGGTSAPATVTITVNPAAPTVAAVSATVAYGSSANPIPLSLGGGTATSVAVSAAAAHGTATASGTSISYTPTPGYHGADSFTYTATNVTGTATPATATITVSAPTILVTPAMLTAGTAGVAYSQSVSAAGGQAPYSFSTTLAGGALPAGLALAGSGAITGTPTASGTFTFSVSGTDSSTTTAVAFTSPTITLVIAAPTITLAPTSLPGGVTGTAYSQTVTASGGTAPYTYSISSGALPPPLTLNGTTGVISGTPNAVSGYSFTVKATDSTTGTGAPYFGTQAYSITTTPVLPTTGAVSATVAYNSTNNAIMLNLGGGAAASVAIASAASHGTATASGTAITYTPTSGYSGTDGFTYTATNATGTSAPATVTITVNPQAPAVAAVSATVGYGSSANPIPLSLGGGTATSVAVSTAAAHGTATAGGTAITYTPTPGYSGPDSFAYTATNITGTSAPATVTITVTPQAPAVGAVSATVAFNSTGNPITLSLGGGTAVSVAVASAAGHGTATASGTSITYTPTHGYSGSDSFTYTATNPGGTSAPATVTITVNPQAPAVAAVSATVGYGSSANPIPLSLGGGTATSVAVSTAAAHGTATAGGTAITYTPTTGYFGPDSFAYTATNITGTSSAATVSITVSAPAIAVTPTTLAAGVVGTPYSQTLTPSGGQAPYSFSTTLASGALPAGLSLASSGVISGTPTANGSFSFAVTGTDSSTATHANFTSATISLTIGAAPPPTFASLSIASGSTVGGTAVTISGTNFIGTPTVSFGGAAATGVTLVNATTVTALSPAHAAGTVDVTVTAAGGTTSTNAGDHFTYIAPPTAGAVAQSVTGNTSGNSVTLSLGGGIATSVAVASAASHGTATASGTAITYTPATGYAGPDSFTYTATNASGTSAPGTVSITVAAPTLALAPSSLPGGTVTAGYSQALTATGGTAPYSYSVASGSLPAGVTLQAGGTLAGTPTAGGSFAVTLKATDATGFSVSKAYTLSISQPSVALTPATLPAPQVNVAYSQTLSASGGTAPYRFTVASGQLPAGLILNASTGALSGTPSTAGSYNVTIQATDSSTGSGPYHASISYQLPTAQQVPVGAAITSTTPANIRDAINVGASVAGPVTSVAVATNPTHGTAVASGVNIIYTPATNYFGQDSFTYTATGPGGTSAPATVAVTVTPLAVPVVQPLTAQVLTNTPVTLNATASASNGPFTAVAIASAPSTGTAVVSGQTIVYTPAPNQTVTASISFTYTVANVYGVSAPGTATITVNPIPLPPPPQTVVLPPATPTSSPTVSVSITDNATGGPFVSASLVTVTPPDAGTITLVPINTQTGSLAPLHMFADLFGIKPAAAATLTVAGHAFNVVFTPNPAFVGTVTVTYTLANAFAASVQGEVVFVVPPRADISVDANVIGLVAAQVEEARRFATAQIGNFNQRLEALHGDGPAHSSNGLSVNFGDAATNTAQADPEDNPLTRGTADIHRLSRNDARNPADSSTPDPKAHQDGGDDGESILPKNLAFWTAGSVDFGARSSTAQRTGFDFTTDGVSGGADYRLNSAFTIGLGGGYGHDSSDIGTDGTKSTADAYNVAIYGSYHPSTETFIDGVLGYGWLSYDSTRLITTTTDFARGHRNGEQSFGSLTAGYEYKTDVFRLTPYGRFDYSDSTLDQFSEQAPGRAALTYFSQSVTTTTATLGFKGDVAVPLEWALFLPFLRVELQHDFQGATRAGLAYADLASAGPAYSVPGDPVDANHMQLGIGANLKVGTFTFGMAFENSFGIHEEQDSQLRLLVTSHF